jgi:hypothetical protein
MFSQHKKVGLPAGPLAEPITVWRRGRGKTHLLADCQPGVNAEQVAPWDLTDKERCRNCCVPRNLPHQHWRTALSNALNAWSAVDRNDTALRDETEPPAHLNRAYARRHRLRVLGELMFDTSELARCRRTPALADWYDGVLAERQHALLEQLTNTLPMFRESDWHLRLGVVTALLAAAAPLPEGIDLPEGLKHFGHAADDLLEGLRWAWLKTAGHPDRDALATAALRNIRAMSFDLLQRGEYGAKDVAYQCADRLITDYETATRVAPMLVRLEPGQVPNSALLRQRHIGASLAQASHCQDLSDGTGTLLVLPATVVELISPGRTAYGTDSPGLLLDVFGPVLDTDDESVFAAAALLHCEVAGEWEHAPEALNMARLAHV